MFNNNVDYLFSLRRYLGNPKVIANNLAEKITSIFSLVIDSLPIESYPDNRHMTKVSFDEETTATVKELGEDRFNHTGPDKSSHFLLSNDRLMIHAESFGDIEEAEKRIGLAILLYKNFLPNKGKLAFIAAYYMAGKHLQQKESFKDFIDYFGLNEAKTKLDHYRNKLQKLNHNISEEEMLNCFHRNSCLPIEQLKFL